VALSSGDAERQPDRDPEADHVSVHTSIRKPKPLGFRTGSGLCGSCRVPSESSPAEG
jgi:hypothetical protein